MHKHSLLAVVSSRIHGTVPTVSCPCNMVLTHVESSFFFSLSRKKASSDMYIYAKHRRCLHHLLLHVQTVQQFLDVGLWHVEMH